MRVSHLDERDLMRRARRVHRRFSHRVFLLPKVPLFELIRRRISYFVLFDQSHRRRERIALAGFSLRPAT